MDIDHRSPSPHSPTPFSKFPPKLTVSDRRPQRSHATAGVLGTPLSLGLPPSTPIPQVEHRKELRRSTTMSNNSLATVLDDLPEFIVDDILLRLPARDVCRCRAVRRSWRSTTSTEKFILDHLRRQPSLPVIHVYKNNDHRLVVFPDAGVGITNRKLCLPVLRYPGQDRLDLEFHASCDGLLVVSSADFLAQERLFYVCNPATRQCGPLPQLLEANHGRPFHSVRIAGFYRHPPSGEYRLLYWIYKNNRGYFYILTMGSNEPSCIQLQHPPIERSLLEAMTCSSHNAPVLHRGCLHWERGQSFDGSDMTVFDTAAETFRWIHRPARLPPCWSLLDMGDVLGLCSTRDGVTINISVMQDYETEVWASKYRIKLSEMDASPPLNLRVTETFPKMAMVNGHELVIELHRRLVHCDIDGKFLGDVEVDCDEDENCRLKVSSHFLKESLILLPCFGMQEEDGLDKMPPFILGR